MRLKFCDEAVRGTPYSIFRFSFEIIQGRQNLRINSETSWSLVKPFKKTEKLNGKLSGARQTQKGYISGKLIHGSYEASMDGYIGVEWENTFN